MSDECKLCKGKGKIRVPRAQLAGQSKKGFSKDKVACPACTNPTTAPPHKE